MSLRLLFALVRVYENNTATNSNKIIIIINREKKTKVEIDIAKFEKYSKRHRDMHLNFNLNIIV